jgi:riboflavin kinase / FMN adenylyltransferase
MKILHGLDDFDLDSASAVTIGFFDGIHLAHQEILTKLVETARNNQLLSVVITFFPHPRTVLNPEAESFHFLSLLEEKIELFTHYSIDYLVIIPFTKTFSELSALDFIQEILIKKARISQLLLGYDHNFGKNREGNLIYLDKNRQNFDFKVIEIPKILKQNISVNSSNIRKLLHQGNIQMANELLGRNYSLSGKVVKGNQLGRTIGFPTANIEVENLQKLLPSLGVYAVEVVVIDAKLEGKIWQGMLNLGTKPTVNGKNVQIEVNIFDFDLDIYDAIIKVFFIERLRDEQKFSSLNDLKEQLISDRMNAKSILNKNLVPDKSLLP